MEDGVRNMFATIAKFILLRLLGFRETFQLPNRFIKRSPPPPPPPPPPNFHSVPFRSSLEPPQSRVPFPVPCVFALHRRRSLLGSNSHQHTGAAPAVTCNSLLRDSASQPWFVPVEPIVTGPGSSLVPLREMVLAYPGLQRLTLRTRLQRHLLHWPLLLFQKCLRLLSPYPGDTRPGWDLGPLLMCIRDHARGPCLPSGLGYQARGSHRSLGPIRRLFQLIRVRRPSYPHIRGSHVRCLVAIRFQGTSIFVPGTSMESHTTTYHH